MRSMKLFYDPEIKEIYLPPCTDLMKCQFEGRGTQTKGTREVEAEAEEVICSINCNVVGVHQCTIINNMVSLGGFEALLYSKINAVVRC